MTVDRCLKNPLYLRYRYASIWYQVPGTRHQVPVSFWVLTGKKSEYVNYSIPVVIFSLEFMGIHMHCLQSSRLYTRDKSIEQYGNLYY